MSSAIVNQAQTRRAAFWHALKELDCLSAFFSWLFMLLTRLSEPLMLLATLYIVAETGVPSIALPSLHNLAVGIMITSPEILLPGAFVVASHASDQGEQRARLLFVVCWLFVLLTLLTLISLFVWHLAGASLAWLMCARCAAAVGYSILMRVMSHSRDQARAVSLPNMTERFSELERTIATQIAESDQRQRTALQTFTSELERKASERGEPLTAADITRALDQQQTALQAQLSAFMQEVKALLDAGPARPKLSLVNAGESGIDKAAFVRSCLSEHPTWRNADIQRAASEQGVNISPAYISEIRKAFLEQSA